MHNSNNDCYWRAHGLPERPADIGDVHARYSNANNPNNPIYGSHAEHPNDYVARVHGRCALAAPLRERAHTQWHGLLMCSTVSSVHRCTIHWRAVHCSNTLKLRHFNQGKGVGAMAMVATLSPRQGNSELIGGCCGVSPAFANTALQVNCAPWMETRECRVSSSTCADSWYHHTVLMQNH